jgi:hypothetical protein
MSNQERNMNQGRKTEERSMTNKKEEGHSAEGRTMAGEEGRAAGHSATHKANENRTATKGTHSETTGSHGANQERAAHGNKGGGKL